MEVREGHRGLVQTTGPLDKIKVTSNASFAQLLWHFSTHSCQRTAKGTAGRTLHLHFCPTPPLHSRTDRQTDSSVCFTLTVVMYGNKTFSHLPCLLLRRCAHSPHFVSLAPFEHCFIPVKHEGRRNGCCSLYVICI